jgi:ATP-dependent DNA helicase RecG
MLPRVLAARGKQWRKEEETRQLVADLCRGCFLTAEQIASLIGRDRDKTQERFLNPMVEEGLLEMQYPRELKHPNQAYTTKVK